MILEDYNVKMVSAPADGFLTQLSQNRNLLLKIHWANHRVELACQRSKIPASVNVMNIIKPYIHC